MTSVIPVDDSGIVKQCAISALCDLMPSFHPIQQNIAYPNVLADLSHIRLHVKLVALGCTMAFITPFLASIATLELIISMNGSMSKLRRNISLVLAGFSWGVGAVWSWIFVGKSSFVTYFDLDEVPFPIQVTRDYSPDIRKGSLFTLEQAQRLLAKRGDSRIPIVLNPVFTAVSYILLIVIMTLTLALVGWQPSVKDKEKKSRDLEDFNKDRTRTSLATLLFRNEKHGDQRELEQVPCKQTKFHDKIFNNWRRKAALIISGIVTGGSTWTMQMVARIQIISLHASMDHVPRVLTVTFLGSAISGSLVFYFLFQVLQPKFFHHLWVRILMALVLDMGNFILQISMLPHYHPYITTQQLVKLLANPRLFRQSTQRTWLYMSFTTSFVLFLIIISVNFISTRRQEKKKRSSRQRMILALFLFEPGGRLIIDEDGYIPHVDIGKMEILAYGIPFNDSPLLFPAMSPMMRPAKTFPQLPDHPTVAQRCQNWFKTFTKNKTPEAEEESEFTSLTESHPLFARLVRLTWSWHNGGQLNPTTPLVDASTTPSHSNANKNDTSPFFFDDTSVSSSPASSPQLTLVTRRDTSTTWADLCSDEVKKAEQEETEKDGEIEKERQKLQAEQKEQEFKTDKEKSSVSIKPPKKAVRSTLMSRAFTEHPKLSPAPPTNGLKSNLIGLGLLAPPAAAAAEPTLPARSHRRSSCPEVQSLRSNKLQTPIEQESGEAWLLRKLEESYVGIPRTRKTFQFAPTSNEAADPNQTPDAAVKHGKRKVPTHMVSGVYSSLVTGLGRTKSMAGSSTRRNRNQREQQLSLTRAERLFEASFERGVLKLISMLWPSSAGGGNPAPNLQDQRQKLGVLYDKVTTTGESPDEGSQRKMLCLVGMLPSQTEAHSLTKKGFQFVSVSIASRLLASTLRTPNSREFLKQVQLFSTQGASISGVVQRSRVYCGLLIVQSRLYDGLQVSVDPVRRHLLPMSELGCISDSSSLGSFASLGPVEEVAHALEGLGAQTLVSLLKAVGHVAQPSGWNPPLLSTEGNHNISDLPLGDQQLEAILEQGIQLGPDFVRLPPSSIKLAVLLVQGLIAQLDSKLPPQAVSYLLPRLILVPQLIPLLPDSENPCSSMQGSSIFLSDPASTSRCSQPTIHPHQPQSATNKDNAFVIVFKAYVSPEIEFPALHWVPWRLFSAQNECVTKNFSLYTEKTSSRSSSIVARNSIVPPATGDNNPTSMFQHITGSPLWSFDKRFAFDSDTTCVDPSSRKRKSFVSSIGSGFVSLSYSKNQRNQPPRSDFPRGGSSNSSSCGCGCSYGNGDAGGTGGGGNDGQSFGCQCSNSHRWMHGRRKSTGSIRFQPPLAPSTACLEPGSPNRDSAGRLDMRRTRYRRRRRRSTMTGVALSPIQSLVDQPACFTATAVAKCSEGSEGPYFSDSTLVDKSSLAPSTIAGRGGSSSSASGVSSDFSSSSKLATEKLRNPHNMDENDADGEDDVDEDSNHPSVRNDPRNHFRVEPVQRPDCSPRLQPQPQPSYSSSDSEVPTKKPTRPKLSHQLKRFSQTHLYTSFSSLQQHQDTIPTTTISAAATAAVTFTPTGGQGDSFFRNGWSFGRREDPKQVVQMPSPRFCARQDSFLATEDGIPKITLDDSTPIVGAEAAMKTKANGTTCISFPTCKTEEGKNESLKVVGKRPSLRHRVESTTSNESSSYLIVPRMKRKSRVHYEDDKGVSIHNTKTTRRLSTSVFYSSASASSSSSFSSLSSLNESDGDDNDQTSIKSNQPTITDTHHSHNTLKPFISKYDPGWIAAILRQPMVPSPELLINNELDWSLLQLSPSTTTTLENTSTTIDSSKPTL